MNDETPAGGMRLGDAMRREADALTVGPAPVEEVLRRGRAARRRRTAVLSGAATAAVALVVLAAFGDPAPHREPAPPAKAPAATTGSPAAPRTVRPYEPVAIGDGVSVALLPDGAQNYVVGPGDIRPAVEASRVVTGDNIRPNSLSSGFQSGGPRPLYAGAFRFDSLPARIEVRLDSGTRHAATLLRLPGAGDWGVYYAFGAPGGPPQGWTVTAYAADGRVLADEHFAHAGTGAS